VVIQGNQLTSTGEIRQRMKTRPGEEYVPEVVQDDVRNLYATGRFGNVWADTLPDGPGRVKVQVYLRDFPSRVARVAYQGNRSLPASELEKATGLRAGVPLNPLANRVACRRILQRYHEEGLPNASCKLVRGGQVGDTEVIFRIREGYRPRVRQLAFSMTSAAGRPVFHRWLERLRKSRPRSRRPPWLTEHDLRRLILLYRAAGFPAVRIVRGLSYSPDRSEVDLAIGIDVGTRRTSCRSSARARGPLPRRHELIDLLDTHLTEYTPCHRVRGPIPASLCCTTCWRRRRWPSSCAGNTPAECGSSSPRPWPSSPWPG
jgi:outer membrane protein assembly factor BamA